MVCLCVNSEGAKARVGLLHQNERKKAQGLQEICKGKVIPITGLCGPEGKAIPLQAWSGPEGSRKLRFPDYMTTAQDGGKVVSLTHRLLLPPRKYSWYSFLLEAESTPGP